MGNGRRFTASTSDIGIRKIECAQDRSKIHTIDAAIDTATPIEATQDVDGGTAHFGVELSCDGNERVSHHLETKSATIEFPQQPVVRIDEFWVLFFYFRILFGVGTGHLPWAEVMIRRWRCFRLHSCWMKSVASQSSNPE